MINILLNASVTGAIIIILWRLLYPVSKKYFRAAWHYAILKIAILFMLIPVSILAPRFNNIFAVKPAYISEQININAEAINLALSDIILFTTGISKMHRLKKQFLNSNSNNAEHETLELFLQCKRELKMRGRINLRRSKYIKTPLAFGLLKPVIILPETDMSADEKRFAIIHELTHIKNGDLMNLKNHAGV